MTVRRTFAADPSLQFRRHPTFPIRRATFLRFAVLSKRRMAFLLSKSASLSRFQIHSQPNKGLGPFLPHRQFHIELGAREKALLEEDPALKKFKSYKKSVWRLKRVGDFLTIVVVAGCCYEIYVKTVMKKAAVQEAQAKSNQA